MHSFNKRAAALLGGLVLALGLLAPSATHADEWNLMTRFQINHPFQAPGATLEPNTPYVIRLLDSPSTRNVVQIFNEDQDQLLTMFIAVSAARLEPEDDTVFTFTEMEPGYPLPIEKWFYPGRLNGLEFIYPKEQAAEIARHVKGTAVAVAQVPEEPVTEPGFIPEPEEEVAQEPAIEEPAEEPAFEEPAPVEEPAPIEEEEPLREEFPDTAGELPLMALLGLLSLGLGVGVRALKARS
jgi:hypothetical protein